MHYPKKYQDWFILKCFEACNSPKSLKKSIRLKIAMAELRRKLKIEQRRVSISNQ